MGKYLRNMLGLLAILMMASCARYTCPTYFDTYNHEPGAANQFFNYFKSTESQGYASSGGGDVFASADEGFLETDEEATGLDGEEIPSSSGWVAQKDTFKTENGMLILPDGEEPAEGKLFRGKPRSKNGLASQKLFLGGIFSFPAKKRARNTPKVVKMKTKPDKKKGTEEDSTATQELLYPPEATDQFYYNLEIGNPADSTQADSVETEGITDSLAVEEDEYGEFGVVESVDEGEEEYETDKKGRLKKKKKKNKKKDKGEKEPKEKKPKKKKAKKEKPKKEKKNKDEELDDGMAAIQEE
ncbi:hypothetical protein R9C00_05105 [Flammeovirgaceae bacterium SG7u.111]|nr:hypothetical protein [Flammeovirgaceae bacterium SG7u.132]WPO36823.1 hypothetical protein R9C00_05105 [Flammeovirgaceae bacterium SG7u.111]